VEYRDKWLNPPDASPTELKKRTLTNLYNQRPQWLQDAHCALDKAVLAAYGWPENIGDTEILERLLALNQQRGEGQTNSPSSKRPNSATRQSSKRDRQVPLPSPG